MKIKNIKRFIHIGFIIIFAVFSFSHFVQNAINGFSKIPGYDFNLRYNEVECLRKGIDPYDIVMKIKLSDEYALFATPEARPGVKTLHVYTPWEYTYFLPFSCLSERTAGTIFLILSILSLIIIGIYSYYAGLKIRDNNLDGLFTASASLLLGNATKELFAMANYGAFNALLILFLILALSRNYNVIAGICWAFLMTKPQIGLLFAIPLILKRRYITICVAVFICLVCSIPPSLMCGRTPWELMMEVPRGCAFIAEANGTMIIPSTLFQKFHGTIPSALLGFVSMSIGVAICFLLTWRLRNEKSWFIFIIPTIICAILWSYCKSHDRVILWATQLLLAMTIIRTKQKAVLVFCLLLLPLTAWPFIYSDSALTKLMRRLSLALLLYGCWILPKFSTSNKQIND